MSSSLAVAGSGPGNRYGIVQDYRTTAIAPYLDGDVLEVGAGSASGSVAPDESRSTVFAGYRLQDIGDYRAALQSWFRAVQVGGHLVVAVPHAFLYERQNALPSRWRPAQRRLYTPRSLLDEVEEALAPNSYRIRYLGDHDAGYDYAIDRAAEPVGGHDVLLVLERIAPPAWGLAEEHEIKAQHPDYEFVPNRTRVESVSLPRRRKILILKLDHLGDFIMGIPALEKARAAFRDSEITLVVGSWNLAAARALDVADHVLAFDVFPRNSSEERVDVRGKTALFEALVTDEYDIAIDLRSDHDTRFLLESVRCGVRAGIGTRTQFRFLDIFLPIDTNRNEPETAREELFNHHAFNSAHYALRSEHRIFCAGSKARRECAIVWGPYRTLQPGRYQFEPFLELDRTSEGALSLDIALDGKWKTFTHVPAPDRVRLPFVVEKAGTQFEFRIWAIDKAPALDFSFFGGRLIREGASSVLHQSEYTQLLVELVAMRVVRFGLLEEAGEPA